MNKLTALFVLATTTATAAGCATTPVPADKYARSQAAVRSAEEMNAEREPQAALHLRLAREQVVRARDLMLDGDNERASMVLQRAEADGEAALNIARAKSARIEAQQTITAVQQMKAQIQSEGSQP